MVDAVSPNESAPRSIKATKHSWLPLAMIAGVCLLCAFLYFQIKGNVVDPGTRAPRKYVLAAGFAGKVKITYEVPGAPALPVIDGVQILEIPASGLLQTSSPMAYGYAEDQYERHLADGGVEKLHAGYAKIHKNGLVGDKNEFFDTSDELTRRDEELRKAGQVDEQGNIKLGHPYELLWIRDDF